MARTNRVSTTHTIAVFLNSTIPASSPCASIGCGPAIPLLACGATSATEASRAFHAARRGRTLSKGRRAPQRPWLDWARPTACCQASGVPGRAALCPHRIPPLLPGLRNMGPWSVTPSDAASPKVTHIATALPSETESQATPRGLRRPLKELATVERVRCAPEGLGQGLRPADAKRWEACAARSRRDRKSAMRSHIRRAGTNSSPDAPQVAAKERRASGPGGATTVALSSRDRSRTSTSHTGTSPLLPCPSRLAGN